jgi:hypothetical protein
MIMNTYETGGRTAKHSIVTFGLEFEVCFERRKKVIQKRKFGKKRGIEE